MLVRSKEERIRYCYKNRYISHSNAEAVLDAMKDVYYREPGAVRPACLAVIGASNSGKSATVAQFCSEVGDATAKAGSQDTMPVVKVDVPPRATEPRLGLAIARALGLGGYAGNARIVSDNVYRALQEKRVRVLLLNEIQHVEPIPSSERAIVLDFIKGISNSGISIIAVGTDTACELIARDEQVANRLRVIHLQNLVYTRRNREEYLGFLNTLESFYPLPERSGLADPEFADAIYKGTNGVVGEIVLCCDTAAAYAIRNDRPRIEWEGLQKAAETKVAAPTE
jgi:hypothetical protein